MVEWSITPVLKTGVPRGTGGSNPSLSADYTKRETSAGFPFFFAHGQRAFVHRTLGSLYSSYEQLMNIAHQYLKEMGCGEDGQPILIYAHHDTDNHHLHIVTSRVAPDGHKIDDHHERIRSQEIINRIMGENQGQRASETIKKALEYRFTSLNQFKAILLKYRDMTANKEELRTLMKQKFGIDLVFHGSKDSPYDYTVIDHQNKTVLKGGEVLKLKELLLFQPKEERLHRMDEFIDAILEDHPDLTTRELNRLLRRQFGTYISKGRISYCEDFIDLPS